MSELIKAGYFGRGGVKVRLREATRRLKKWCKMTKRTTALKVFTQDNLVLKGTQTPELWFIQFLISQTFWLRVINFFM